METTTKLKTGRTPERKSKTAAQPKRSAKSKKMNKTDPQKPGGSDAAATSKPQPQPQPTMLTTKQRRMLPLWTDALDYLAQIKWHAEGLFYYSTAEDLERGLSFTETRKLPLSEIRRVDYDFGRYGILPVALIGGEAWCSLDAAASIAGIPAMAVSGHLSEEHLHVRGAPGYLYPDGLRCLKSHAINDTGIRLEALTAHIETHRRDDPSVISMLNIAINDVYQRDWSATGSYAAAYVDLTGVNSTVTEECKIIHRFYDPEVGEMRAVVLGLQVWLSAADVAYVSEFDERVLLKIAGPERTLRIAPSIIDGHATPVEVHAFVRFDAVEKFSTALEWELPMIEHLRHWIERDLLDSDRLLERGAHVMASSLHQMLGSHLDFENWSFQAQSLHSDLQLLEACNNDSFDTPGNDYRIAPGIACKVAEDAKSFAGVVTSKLIREGGYLHGGVIDEPANETLARFFDLAPDSSGTVKLRTVWEFLNAEDTFEEWVAERRALGYELSDSPDCARVSIWSPWCTSIWPTD